MSTLEMKAISFEKLATINEEVAIKKILLFLENLNDAKDEFDADKFFTNASKKYADVLQKLAQ